MGVESRASMENALRVSMYRLSLLSTASIPCVSAHLFTNSSTSWVHRQLRTGNLSYKEGRFMLFSLDLSL